MNNTSKTNRTTAGACIEAITSVVSGIDPNTSQEEFRFFLNLSTGKVLEILFGEVLECSNPPPNRTIARVQVVDGLGDIRGEEIRSVVERTDGFPDLSALSTKDQSELLQKYRQVALILSHDRAVRNLPRCGGGNVLQIESQDNLATPRGRDWRKQWSEVDIRLDVACRR